MGVRGHRLAFGVPPRALFTFVLIIGLASDSKLLLRVELALDERFDWLIVIPLLDFLVFLQ